MTTERIIGGQYRLESPIGSGGMGTVFRARQFALNRSVAVKLLKSDGRIAEEDRRRFEREARLLTTLRHPHLLSVFDADLAVAQPYIVMELIEGPCLLDLLLAPAPRARPDALALAHGLADALAYIHENGVLHRDIKPANVLLRDGTHPLLADFGLARPEGAAALTAEGFVVGTPAYLAPEQFVRFEATEASDVFQLGLTLYEAISGRTLFSPSEPLNVQTLIRRRLEESLPRLSDVAPRCNRRLAAVVMRCLDKDPKHRPTARALAGELTAIRDGQSGLVEVTPIAPDRPATSAHRVVAAAPPRTRVLAPPPQSPRRWPLPLLAVSLAIALAAAAAIATRQEGGENIQTIRQVRDDDKALPDSSSGPARGRAPIRLTEGDLQSSVRESARELRAALRHFWSRTGLTDQKLMNNVRKLLGTRGLSELERKRGLQTLRHYVDHTLGIGHSVRSFLPISPVYFDSPTIPADEKQSLYRLLAPFELLDCASHYFRLPGFAFTAEISTRTGNQYRQSSYPAFAPFKNYGHFFKTTQGLFPRTFGFDIPNQAPIHNVVLGIQYKLDSQSVAKMTLGNLPIYFSSIPRSYHTSRASLPLQTALEEGSRFAMPVREFSNENSALSVHSIGSSRDVNIHSRVTLTLIQVQDAALVDNDRVWSTWIGLGEPLE